MRRHLLEAGGLAAVACAIYAAGACRTIFVGDSGELAAAVHTLGIPHPTGYPLYVLLGKLWTLLLPVGSVALRLSLFSAACAGLAVGTLFLTCRMLGLSRVASAFGAGLLLVAPSFWGEANVQRVYALNALFVVVVAALAFRWAETGRDRTLVAAFFACGLGASNHTFMAVEACALLVFAWISHPGVVRKPRLLLSSACAFGAGLLPYLYLPLRSRLDPRLDWGNPETLAAFLDVVLRREYWERAWTSGFGDVLKAAADYQWSLGSELLWVGGALALLGAFVGPLHGLPVLFPLLVMAGNLAAVMLHGSRTDIFVWHRYYIPSYLMAALLAAIGCERLLARLPRAARALPLLLPLLGLATGWRDHDRSRYRVADDWSRKLLASLPPGAHLQASNDNVLFVLTYLTLVEGLRPDVDLVLSEAGVDEGPLNLDPYHEALFFTHHPNWRLPRFDVVPVGLAYRLVSAGERPAPVLPKDPLAGASDPRVPKDDQTRSLIGHFHFMLGVSLWGRDYARAFDELEEAARAAPDDDVLLYNLGLHYARHGLLPEALAAFEASNAINPRALPAAGGPRSADRIAETRAGIERLRPIEERAAEGLPADAGAERELQLADRLEAAGEPVAARGHRARAWRTRPQAPPES